MTPIVLDRACGGPVHRLSILIGSLVVLLAACLGVDGTACEALPTEIDLELSADALTPADPTVCRGETVTLRVSPEVDGVLHVHGYDAEVPATAVTAGEVAELRFSAARSGQFPIELHTDANTQGASVGILTVNEP